MPERVCQYCGRPVEGAAAVMHPACVRAALMASDGDKWENVHPTDVTERDTLYRTLHEDRTLPGEPAA